MFKHQLTNECRQVLLAARTEAIRLGHAFVSPDHLLLALLAEPGSESSRALIALGVKSSQVRNELEAELRKHRSPETLRGTPAYTSRARSVLESAIREARGTGTRADSLHLLLGILVESRSTAAQSLHRLGANADDVRRMIDPGVTSKADLDIQIDDRSDTVIYEQIINQIKEAVATGGIKPGGRLPPVRQLADDLGIAPGTVARAYSELETSRVIVTDGSKGTFVAVPGRGTAPAVSLRDLLRPMVVAAYHLGASATDVRDALEDAMKDVYRDAA